MRADDLAALKAWLTRAPMGYAGFDRGQCEASVAAIEALEAENAMLTKRLDVWRDIGGDAS